MSTSFLPDDIFDIQDDICDFLDDILGAHDDPCDLYDDEPTQEEIDDWLDYEHSCDLMFDRMEVVHEENIVPGVTLDGARIPCDKWDDK